LAGAIRRSIPAGGHQYEVSPRRASSTSRIQSGLAEDLCLALKRSRFSSNASGKSTVGIEVPNAHRQTIALREQIESAEFVNSPSKLTSALARLMDAPRLRPRADASLAVAGSRDGQERYSQLTDLSMLDKDHTDALEL